MGVKPPWGGGRIAENLTSPPTPLRLGLAGACSGVVVAGGVVARGLRRGCATFDVGGAWAPPLRREGAVAPQPVSAAALANGRFYQEAAIGPGGARRRPPRASKPEGPRARRCARTSGRSARSAGPRPGRCGERAMRGPRRSRRRERPRAPRGRAARPAPVAPPACVSSPAVSTPVAADGHTSAAHPQRGGQPAAEFGARLGRVPTHGSIARSTPARACTRFAAGGMSRVVPDFRGLHTRGPGAKPTLAASQFRSGPRASTPHLRDVRGPKPRAWLAPTAGLRGRAQGGRELGHVCPLGAPPCLRRGRAETVAPLAAGPHSNAPSPRAGSRRRDNEAHAAPPAGTQNRALDFGARFLDAAGGGRFAGGGRSPGRSPQAGRTLVRALTH